MDLIAIVAEVRRNYTDFDRKRQSSDWYNSEDNVSFWNHQWTHLCLVVEDHNHALPKDFKIDKKLVQLMRTYHSFFNRSGSSTSFPGLVWARPWEVHCQEIFDVACHERKYERFTSLIASHPASDPLTAMQALAEASRRTFVDTEVSTHAAETGQAHIAGPQNSFQACRPTGGPRNTDELRHGNMRATDEAIAGWNEPRSTQELLYGNPRSTDEAVIGWGQPRRADEVAVREEAQRSSRASQSTQYIEEETLRTSRGMGMDPRTSTFF